MKPLAELSQAVKARRSDMGLTVTAVARLSGLSRATVSSLENGSIKDLSLVRAQRLLEVMGLSLNVPAVHKRLSLDPLGRRPALEIAAQTSNVSLKTRATATALQPAFLNGAAPEALLPHIRILLDEAPVALLARVADQLNADARVDRKVVWANMRTFAERLQVKRDIFAPEATLPVRKRAAPKLETRPPRQAYAGDPGISSRLERMDDEVRTGKRAPETLALMSREMVRRMRVTQRPDAVDEGTAAW